MPPPKRPGSNASHVLNIAGFLQMHIFQKAGTLHEPTANKRQCAAGFGGFLLPPGKSGYNLLFTKPPKVLILTLGKALKNGKSPVVLVQGPARKGSSPQNF